MPRPKSGLKPTFVDLGPVDLDRAHRIAKRLGLVNAAGSEVGKPNRSAAIREALRIADEATEKAG
jgi:hypothetical protein